MFSKTAEALRFFGFRIPQKKSFVNKFRFISKHFFDGFVQVPNDYTIKSGIFCIYKGETE